MKVCDTSFAYGDVSRASIIFHMCFSFHFSSSLIAECQWYCLDRVLPYTQ